MGQLVALGDHCFDADRVMSVGPAGTGLGSPPDTSRILIQLNMNEWTAIIEVSGNDYSLDEVRETINDHRTPVRTNAQMEAQVTKGEDKWGNPTFRVGVLEVTAYPKHGRYGQIAINDPDFAVLQWNNRDLWALSEAFRLAAIEASGS